jgi:anti-sigma regulatory factor (Ser/Thr protein kinase)
MGEGKRFSARVPAGDDPAPAIVGFLAAADEFVALSGIAQGLAARLLVSVEELVSNSLRHGSGGRDIEVVLNLREANGGVRLSLEDTGRPFDPWSHQIFAGPDGESGGGVGLELLRQWASDTEYRRGDGRNHVSFTLR